MESSIISRKNRLARMREASATAIDSGVRCAAGADAVFSEEIIDAVGAGS